MMELWHCTPQKNEVAIDEEGLCPQFEWVHTAGNAVAYGVKPTWKPPGTELEWMRVWQLQPIHISEYIADDFVAGLHVCDTVVVYEVNPLGLTLHPGYDGPTTYAVREWVPPQQLRKHAYYRLDGEGE